MLHYFKSKEPVLHFRYVHQGSATMYQVKEMHVNTCILQREVMSDVTALSFFANILGVQRD